MKWWIALLAPVALACSINPVVTPPREGGGDRYYDCNRAARDYCRDAVRASDAELKQCVAEATYRCVAGTGAKP